ncbi:interleukin 12 receptor, beta 2a, like isoform X2 [Sparus aurata]|uniref:interleukin 12 receptor, beta 2a, like isoform X2 n=1 Tax=Sparus aurata TaxID=8175 RepID=UPI0011C13672|nr:interleukin-6 receptor subunit beta-like isoform X2 [Sparus aurata]
MATLKTGWLLSILLVNLPNCIALAVPPGPPATLSTPECYIPCDEKKCFVDIHCTLDQRQEPQIPTNYSLHWEPGNNSVVLSTRELHVISGTRLTGLIHREHFIYHGGLRVWVQAMNRHGSAKSEEVEFDTANIFKPPPPKVSYSHQEPFEIHWNSFCDQLDLNMGSCAVRHRTEADQVWVEEEEGFYGSYTFENRRPCTAYEFQVCCACTGLTSDWSDIERILAIETTPVGKLDVWVDCGIYPPIFDCFLTWKKLPVSQACGVILGYEVRLFYKNGTSAVVNGSIAERYGMLCDEVQCHFNSSLKDASSVSVSAYNAHGATVPSYLTLPVPGKEKNEQALHLKMNEENLTVSWNLPSQLSDTLKEYVVQYKQAGSPLGQAFDWVKVNKSQTAAFFKGQFKNYKPYQVSLFEVLHNGKVHYLLSAIGYSLQRIPSKLPSFAVPFIATTHVNLRWDPGPLSKQDGLILYYQIGLDGQNVYNVSASHRNFTLQHLSPGQKYGVWIRAVSAIGTGENATLTFETKHANYPVLWVIPCLFGICFLIGLSACRGNKVCSMVPLFYCDKVPDPRNSHIFREMKQQINDPLTWICIPIHEPHPKISLLEVVEIQPGASKSSLEETSDTDGLIRPVVGEGSSQMDCQDDQMKDGITKECPRTNHKYGREAYSKMVDSDEERDEEDCWNSSEEEQGTSGYEKHFMPTVSEILAVL